MSVDMKLLSSAKAPTCLDSSMHTEPASVNRFGRDCQSVNLVQRTLTNSSDGRSDVEASRSSRLVGMFEMASSETLRKVGISNLSVGSLCILFQTIVTVMAYIYQGLYAWNSDAPLLAKCMTGIFAGIICLVLGYTQVDAAKELRKLSPADLGQRFCAVKLFSCFLMLFGVMLFGFSLYLTSVLYRWLGLSREYDGFVQGPVTVSLALNIGLALLAVATVCLALMGLILLPDL